MQLGDPLGTALPRELPNRPAAPLRTHPATFVRQSGEAPDCLVELLRIQTAHE